ncbi:MAG: metal-dependent hydrolase [Oligoflexia bacterium]|nr:metal-dependent hydrolase [Oligoflexia bacterium]
MLFFGHLGIGNAIAAPFRRGLSLRWLLFGTVAPDLFDKALYYGLSWSTGRRGAELGLISGTRTVSHTALFLLLLCLVAWARKSRLVAALSLGIATHLLLDGLGDLYGHGMLGPQSSPLLWPLLYSRFPVYPFADAAEHLATWRQPFILGGELVGLLLLSWEGWKLRHRRELREQRKLTEAEKH